MPFANVWNWLHCSATTDGAEGYGRGTGTAHGASSRGGKYLGSREKWCWHSVKVLNAIEIWQKRENVMLRGFYCGKKIKCSIVSFIAWKFHLN